MQFQFYISFHETESNPWIFPQNIHKCSRHIQTNTKPLAKSEEIPTLPHFHLLMQQNHKVASKQVCRNGNGNWSSSRNNNIASSYRIGSQILSRVPLFHSTLSQFLLLWTLTRSLFFSLFHVYSIISITETRPYLATFLLVWEKGWRQKQILFPLLIIILSCSCSHTKSLPLLPFLHSTLFEVGRRESEFEFEVMVLQWYYFPLPLPLSSIFPEQSIYGKQTGRVPRSIRHVVVVMMESHKIMAHDKM